MSVESVIPPNHPILCHPLLFLLPTFPSVWVFSMSLGSPLSHTYPGSCSNSILLGTASIHPFISPALKWQVNRTGLASLPWGQPSSAPDGQVPPFPPQTLSHWFSESWPRLQQQRIRLVFPSPSLTCPIRIRSVSSIRPFALRSSSSGRRLWVSEDPCAGSGIPWTCEAIPLARRGLPGADCVLPLDKDAIHTHRLVPQMKLKQ